MLSLRAIVHPTIVVSQFERYLYDKQEQKLAPTPMVASAIAWHPSRPLLAAALDTPEFNMNERLYVRLCDFET